MRISCSFLCLLSCLPLLRGWNLSSSNRILVVGQGGREHCIASYLAKSPLVKDVVVAPGNAGCEAFGGKLQRLGAPGTQTEWAAVAKEQEFDLVVIGPEAPLVTGLGDELRAAGVKVFGPSALAARLEGSKAWAKDFMTRHCIPTAAFRSFKDYEEACTFLSAAKEGSVEWALSSIPVIKASGLASGKGVIVPSSWEEAFEALKDIMVLGAFGTQAGKEVVIEERLVGQEVSLMAFCNGTQAKFMPPAQDHKRALEGGKGPNTGGMGAICPAGCVEPRQLKLMQEASQSIMDGMAAEGAPYSGVLYGGWMLTPSGPKLLEVNCRFGDPETQAVVPLLKSDLFEVCLGCAEGREVEPLWRQGTMAAAVVAASAGYPEACTTGQAITGIQQAAELAGVQVFHAATKVAGAEVTTTGGRVLAVTGTGPSLSTALDSAYEGLSVIGFEGMTFRHDIGREAIASIGCRKQGGAVRVAVLASGRGTSAKPILAAIRRGELEAELCLVVSNRPNSGAITWAQEEGLPHKVAAQKGARRRDAAIDRYLLEAGAEVLLLVGYNRVLSPRLVAQWAGRCFNVHPSLLPKFKGMFDMEVHRAVLASGAKETGCTVHLVTDDVDAGPAVHVATCEVLPDDTPEVLRTRVQKLEGSALQHTIRSLTSGRSVSRIK